MHDMHHDIKTTLKTTQFIQVQFSHYNMEYRILAKYRERKMQNSYNLSHIYHYWSLIGSRISPFKRQEIIDLGWPWMVITLLCSPGTLISDNIRFRRIFAGVPYVAARFQTTSEFDRDYLRNRLRHRQAANNVINHDPSYVRRKRFGERWCTNHKV